MRERFYRIRPTIACRPLRLSEEEWTSLTQVISGVPGVVSCEAMPKFKKVRVIIQDDAFIGDIGLAVYPLNVTVWLMTPNQLIREKQNEQKNSVLRRSERH